jgi:hypothetical protein
MALAFAKTAFNSVKNKSSGLAKTLKSRTSELANKARSRFSRKQTGPEPSETVPETTPEAAAPEAVASGASAAEPSSSPPADTGTVGGTESSIPVEGMVAKMYPRLKECLCESLAKMFTDSSPRLMEVAIQTVENKINTDPQIRHFIDARIKFISESILKEQETKDMIVASLTDQCKRPTIAVAGGGRKTRKHMKMGHNSKKYTRFVYKNT